MDVSRIKVLVERLRQTFDLEAWAELHRRLDEAEAELRDLRARAEAAPAPPVGDEPTEAAGPAEGEEPSEEP